MTNLVTRLVLPLRRRQQVTSSLFELRADVAIAFACSVVLTFLLFQSSGRSSRRCSRYALPDGCDGADLFPSFGRSCGQAGTASEWLTLQQRRTN